MTRQELLVRNSLVVKYKLEGHSGQETAKKFNLSINQIWIILRKYRNGK